MASGTEYPSAAIALLDVASLTTYACSVLADMLIIYVILRHDLQKALTHLVVLNWCILDVAHLTTSPTLYSWYRKASDVYEHPLIEEVHSCVYLSSEVGVVLFLLVLLIKDNVSAVRQYRCVAVCCIWSLTIAFTLASGLGDAKKAGILRTAVFLAAYAVLLVATVVHLSACCCTNAAADADRRLRLTLVTTYVCLWLQLFVVTVVVHVLTSTYGVEIGYLVSVAVLLAEAVAMVGVYVLQRLDKRFRLCLYRTFRRNGDKCSATTNSMAEEDAL